MTPSLEALRDKLAEEHHAGDGVWEENPPRKVAPSRASFKAGWDARDAEVSLLKNNWVHANNRVSELVCEVAPLKEQAEKLRKRVKELEGIVREELEDNREKIKGSGGHVWSGYSGAIEACESILERFSEALGGGEGK